MSEKREEAKAKKLEEEKQHKKVHHDLLWYCTEQELFDNVNEGKTDEKEIISDDEIYKYKIKVVHWVLDKTDYNLEVSKQFISFAIQEYPKALFELLKQGFVKNINTIWWQYETKQKIVEKSKNIEKPDVESKMELGQSTSSFSNKSNKNKLSETTNLSTAEVVASKQQSLGEGWNEVNELSNEIQQSGENLKNAKLVKSQSIMSGAVEIGQSTSNILSSSMSALSTPQIINDLTSMIVSETTSYVASAIKDITIGTLAYTAKFPARIISLTSYYYKQHLANYKITLDDIIMSEESKAQLELEKSKSLEKKKILDVQTQKVQEKTIKINNVVSSVTSGMNNVAAYISEGPEWVTNQCTKLLFNGLSYVGKLRDITLQSVQEGLENKADSIARDKAAKDFKDFDEEKKKALKKQYEQTQINAMKVKLKASQAVAVAKSKIIAKLGL